MDIFDQLKRDEGYRANPYTDTTGKITIGYGFNLTDTGLPRDECNAVLEIKVQKVRMALAASLPFYATLDTVRQGVLENMTYNLGLNGLLQFHRMLTAMETSDWQTAANEMRSSLWAQQVGARAGRLAQQLQSGEWV